MGGQWRRLRRISKEHLFSAQQLDARKLLCRNQIRKLVNYVQCSISSKPVNVGRAAFATSHNVLSNFIFSTGMALLRFSYISRIQGWVSSLVDIAGKANLADFFPLLKPWDPQGLLQKGNVYAEKLMAILNEMVDQRVQVNGKSLAGASFTSQDVLDLLLDFSQKNESVFSRNDMLHMLLQLIQRRALWTELLHNPEKMAKARSELVGITGKDNMIVEESDISKLPYLAAVVKETLRLHPPVPFLLPHRALCDVEVNGFTVPKDARILRNVWAIGRDPSIWSEPQMFMPDRFLNTNIDYKGRDFELIPLGSGKRICPGLPLAHRMLHLMLGSLICKYEWKLDGDMKPKDIDMNERFGITLHKNVPLIAIPVKI